MEHREIQPKVRGVRISGTQFAIAIGAAIIALSILIATRFERMSGDGGYFVVSDRWTGAITRCYETEREPATRRQIKPTWFCESNGIVGPSPAFWR